MKNIRILTRSLALLTASLLATMLFTSCDKDDSGVDTNLIGRSFQGSLVTNRGTAAFYYSQYIYRFISSGKIEVFRQDQKTVGTTNTYGVSGPDTLNYTQNGVNLEIKLKDASGAEYEFGYQGVIDGKGLNLYAAKDIQCAMTQRAALNLNGSSWTIRGELPTGIPSDLVLAFANDKMTFTSQESVLSVADVSYRTAANVLVAMPFTIGTIEFDNLVILYMVNYNVTTNVYTYSLYTNINGTGVSFAKKTE